MKLVSIVVPCYNEEKVLPLFYAEITKVMSQMQEKYPELDFELLFINDGSKDGTLQEFRKMAKMDHRVRYVSFSRNFGKEAGMYAGLQHAKGDYVVIMDADLQHPPAFLPQMYEYVKDGEYDCATTRRVSRKGESKIRSWFSRKFYKIMNHISQTEIVDGAQDFRFMTRQMVNAILEMKEYNRFSKGIFSWVGFRTRYIPYENVERAAGTTSWSFKSLFKYSLEGIFAFSTAPLALASLLGIVSCLLAFIMILVVVIKYLAFGDPVQGYALYGNCRAVFVENLSGNKEPPDLSGTGNRRSRTAAGFKSESESAELKPHTQTAHKNTDSTPKKGMWLCVFFLLLIAGLGIAVSRFYAAKTEDPSTSRHVSSAPEQDSCYIFQEESTGLYGLSDADGRIIAAAEWKNLSFIGDHGIAAVKQIGTESVMGVLDREGNVIVPFVYQDLSYVNNQILVGKLLHEDLYFLYDRSFQDLTNCTWNAYLLKDDGLTLQRGTDSFFYQQIKDGIVLRSFDLQRTIQRKIVTMHCEHRVTAQRYPVEVWQMLGDDLSEFLKAYQRNDETAAAAFLSSDAISQLHPLIPKNKAEKWLVDWNSSIGISSQMTQDNTVFCTITVKRDTESAVLRVAFSTESTAGTLQITGLEILQEKAEKTEESSALETTADFVINDGGRDISANPFGSVQEE